MWVTLLFGTTLSSNGAAPPWWLLWMVSPSAMVVGLVSTLAGVFLIWFVWGILTGREHRPRR